MTEQGSQLGGFLERSHVLEGNTEGKKSFLTFVTAGCYSHLAVSLMKKMERIWALDDIIDILNQS